MARHARKKPEEVILTSVGVGSTWRMVGELLGVAANAKLLHVPYSAGGAPAQAVIAGDVDVLADTPTVASPRIKSGRLRARRHQCATVAVDARDPACIGGARTSRSIHGLVSRPQQKDIPPPLQQGRVRPMDELDRALLKCSQEVNSSLIGEAKALLVGRSPIASRNDRGAEGNAR